MIEGGSVSHRHMQEQIGRFEEDLRRVPGIRTARIVGDDSPTEIHVVAEKDRSPKQVVRDVQSLAAAAYGMSIDHRIVSVVQMDDNGTGLGGATDTGNRAVIEWVMMASQGNAGRVDVGLKWPSDGQTSGGANTLAGTRDARARAAAEAVVQALDPILSGKSATVEIDTVLIQKIGSDDSVLVKALYRERNSVTPVIGTALIQDDVVTATARALLHALNRKIS